MKVWARCSVRKRYLFHWQRKQSSLKDAGRIKADSPFPLLWKGLRHLGNSISQKQRGVNIFEKFESGGAILNAKRKFHASQAAHKRCEKRNTYLSKHVKEEPYQQKALYHSFVRARQEKLKRKLSEAEKKSAFDDIVSMFY